VSGFSVALYGSPPLLCIPSFPHKWLSHEACEQALFNGWRGQGSGGGKNQFPTGSKMNILCLFFGSSSNFLPSEGGPISPQWMCVGPTHPSGCSLKTINHSPGVTINPPLMWQILVVVQNLTAIMHILSKPHLTGKCDPCSKEKCKCGNKSYCCVLPGFDRKVENTKWLGGGSPDPPSSPPPPLIRRGVAGPPPSPLPFLFLNSKKPEKSKKITKKPAVRAMTLEFVFFCEFFQK